MDQLQRWTNTDGLAQLQVTQMVWPPVIERSSIAAQTGSALHPSLAPGTPGASLACMPLLIQRGC